jgi:RNA polymerase sigma-70 factor (ECF subfamily)
LPLARGVRPLPEQPTRQSSSTPNASAQGLSDQELLDGLRQSSEIHFNELYSRYFQRIYNFAYGRVRNHADVEEIVQETFTAVFRSVESYRGQSSLLSWIYGIAKNTINNHLRRNKVLEQKKERVEAELARPDSALVSDTPEDQLNLHRYTDEIRARLESVAPWQAEIFVMRHVENLSIGEISERTDRSSDAIRSSLYRVKRLLIEAVDPPMSAMGS